MALTDNQLTRYARHILLPEIGGAGQAKIMNAKVLVVGAGGLGSPVILYLAAAAPGHCTPGEFHISHFWIWRRRGFENHSRAEFEISQF